MVFQKWKNSVSDYLKGKRSPSFFRNLSHVTYWEIGRRNTSHIFPTQVTVDPIM